MITRNHVAFYHPSFTSFLRTYQISTITVSVSLPEFVADSKKGIQFRKEHIMEKKRTYINLLLLRKWQRVMTVTHPF